MTEHVADGVLGKFARQLNDWFRRVREGSLNHEEVARAVQNIINRGHPFVNDRRKDGWELLEDVDFSPIIAEKLEPITFLRAGENSISGREMVRRAREELRANLGQRHAEYLLEHQQDIPKEFREYYIVFTGTVWRPPGGRLLVACLRWRGEQWVLNFSWLEAAWSSVDRLARPRE